jgi:hypothetical protein
LSRTSAYYGETGFPGKSSKPEERQRVVAIKVMAPQVAASASARKRFTREGPGCRSHPR